MNNIKIEYQQIKSDTPASIGLMVEINAPAAPTANIVARPSRGIVFVVDRSGSMGGGRLEVVKSTILDILGQLDANDYLSIVTFDHEPNIEQPLSKVGDLDLAATRKLVADLRTGGNTNLERGYRFGLAEAASAPAGVETTVILLSDGKANNGSTDPQALGQLAAAATEHLITTSTLGIGRNYDENILVEMSNTGRGNHFAAVDFAEAALGLNEEISALLTRTISNLTVSVRGEGALQSHARFSTPHYVHRTDELENHGKRYYLGALGSLEERNFVAELNIKAIGWETWAEAGTLFVEVEWLDETTGQQVKIEKSFTIGIVPADQWVEPARDEDIVMELATVRAQAEKERAIALAREGHIDQARELINAMGLDIDEMSAAMSDLSPRNRARASRQRRELTELAAMEAEMFIKRGAESIKRGLNSKPDPRDARRDNNEEEA